MRFGPAIQDHNRDSHFFSMRPMIDTSKRPVSPMEIIAPIAGIIVGTLYAAAAALHAIGKCMKHSRTIKRHWSKLRKRK